MTKEYKRKFLVEGNTILTCESFIKKCNKKYGLHWGAKPCTIKTPTTRKTRRTYARQFLYTRDETRCPFRINKPRQYIVSETLDGEWQCSCPVWKFRREECHHIRKAKSNPEKYKIAKEHTGKTINTFTNLFEGMNNEKT